MKGVHPVTSGLLLTVSCVSVLIYLASTWQDEDSIREEVDLQRVVRSLSAIQHKNDVILSKIEKDAIAVVTKHFPWLPKKNMLPNYFLASGTDIDNSYYKYHDSNLAFLQYPRAAGQMFNDCLRDISRKNHLAMSPHMTSKHRLLWETGKDNLDKIRSRLKMHSGRYVFGACEKLNDSCSYFLILRDPMDQAISSWNYCKETYDDEICRGFNANRMSLRDWIINQGSVLFHQIMLNMNVCGSDFHINNTVPEEIIFNHKDFPCWLKQKIFLDQFSKTTIIHAENYIIHHLQDWFAVVGWVEEMTNTLEMFEKVYKLPFTKCKHYDKKRTLSVYRGTKADNSAKSSYQTQSDLYDENDPVLLSQDVYVQQALSSDFRIYKEALKLYRVQKQTLTNKIRL